MKTINEIDDDSVKAYFAKIKYDTTRIMLDLYRLQNLIYPSEQLKDECKIKIVDECSAQPKSRVIDGFKEVSYADQRI